MTTEEKICELKRLVDELPPEGIDEAFDAIQSIKQFYELREWARSQPRRTIVVPIVATIERVIND